MTLKIISESGSHRRYLQELIASTQNMVRVASAYVTDFDLLPRATLKDTRLLTPLSTMDIIAGATSLDSLEKLIAKGVQCRRLPNNPRFHAKIYIFDAKHAVVTSANLTKSALDSNIEVGLQVNNNYEVQELIDWFDKHWDMANQISLSQVSNLKHETAPLRHEFSLMRRRCQSPTDENFFQDRAARPVPLQFKSHLRYFLCNTDRAHSDRSVSGGFVLEDLMHEKCYAAAWEEFSYPSHMERVNRGDIVFMYANQKGIIAVGQAKDTCETLQVGSNERIFNGTNTPEWRIPVDWLIWEDELPSSWSPHADQTFVEVSKDLYFTRREDVMQWLVSLET